MLLKLDGGMFYFGLLPSFDLILRKLLDIEIKETVSG